MNRSGIGTNGENSESSSGGDTASYNAAWQLSSGDLCARCQYLEWLKCYSDRYLLKIWAYCLMNNHVHFVAVPGSEESMARTFNTLHMRYAQYANARQGEKGHLWQGRYYSCALDEKHVYAAVRYVENNPVSARVVKKAESYKWSSAESHVRKMRDQILAMDCYLVKEIKDWAAYLEEKDDAGTTQALRENTKTGRPCGDEKFIRKIEQAVGRRLVALRRGRPKKANKWALCLFVVP